MQQASCLKVCEGDQWLCRDKGCQQDTCQPELGRISAGQADTALSVLQLHAACVEISAGKDAEVKYSTVQNWYAGDENGQGGVLNFVTKRGLCAGERSKISWTQVETGSAITWK